MMSRDEDLKKEFKKEFIYYGIFTFIGIAALISYAIGFEKSVMCGIAIGFIPTGIGGLLIYRKAKTHPGLAKNFKLEREERNIYISSKAGHAAFWVSYGYVFLAYVFSNLVNVTMQQFAIFTLILMPVVHLIFVAIYHRKY